MTRIAFIALLLLCSSAPALADTPASHHMSPGTPGVRTSMKPGYRRLSPQALHDALGHKHFLLINVHIPYQGQIAGTDRFIPFDTISRSSALPTDKSAPIVLYCRSGRMSAIAARALVARGYTHVSELSGGFDAWADAGYEVLQK